MTNEELERAVDALMPFKSPVNAAVTALCRSLVLQAYEEAINATCYHCKAGAPIKKVVNTWNNLGDYYIHPNAMGGLHDSCNADSIRALKDSLAQEPVSSPS